MVSKYEQKLKRAFALRNKFENVRRVTIKEGKINVLIILARAKKNTPWEEKSYMRNNSVQIATIIPHRKEVFFFPRVLKYAIKKKKRGR